MTTYTVYYYRDNDVFTYATNDFRTACVVAANEVFYLGCSDSYVMDSQTGELVKHYTKD